MKEIETKIREQVAGGDESAVGTDVTDDDIDM